MGRESPLREHHTAAGADFTEFGGWQMPVSFDSIRTEHRAVRERAGKFDVSHMGQVVVDGPDAAALTRRLVTSGLELAPGEAEYAAITDEEGVMLDDTVLYRLPGRDGYLFVPNAGHDGGMADRWAAHRDRWGLDATVDNRTGECGMVAVQGPEAAGLLGETTDAALDDVGRFEAVDATVAGVDCLVARTGYTGEDGFEVLCPADGTADVWAALDCRPCGLGARDTLRIEAGLLLSGQDFDPATEPRTPYEAGIGFAVDLDTEFVGRNALAEATDPAECLTGLTMVDRGIARHGHPVESLDGDRIGRVTSGTMSPTLGEAVALAYLPAGLEGEVNVWVREEPKKARITDPPFLP